MFPFQINAVLLNLVFVEYKAAQLFFNMDNTKKSFSSSKSVYYYDFWRSCDTEDWRNDAENTDLITGINYNWQYINTENSYFKLNMFHNIADFTGFLNK